MTSRVHTPGGLVLAAMQIARAVEAHKAKVTAYVPVYAMSGGTLIALAADEIVLGEFSVLGPIDPQIAGLPAASKARDSKPVESVFDLTLVLADVAEKARKCAAIWRNIVSSWRGSTPSASITAFTMEPASISSKRGSR
jgi:ClpP class serine protease